MMTRRRKVSSVPTTSAGPSVLGAAEGGEEQWACQLSHMAAREAQGGATPSSHPPTQRRRAGSDIYDNQFMSYTAVSFLPDI